MDLGESIDHALKPVDEGAGLLDIGGVKAGPGVVEGRIPPSAALRGLWE
jgi:hypothetical protein